MGATMTEADNRKVEFLRAELRSHIQRTRRRSNSQKRFALLFRTAVIVMSSLVTISLGLKGNPIFNGMEDLLSATSLIMSAAVSAIAALEAFLDPRALWIKFTNTLWALYRLKDDVEFKAIAPKPVSTEDLNSLYQRLQGLLIEANAAWSDRRERATDTTQNAKVR